MQNLNNGKRDSEEVHRKLIEARIHLDFCAELYKMQIEGGRHYLHEHPMSASSWNENVLRKLLNIQITLQHEYTCVHMK